MSYYKSLGLENEPFSTSPDPAFFYESGEHKRALSNLLIELNLRRGISVILGDIGTGKTTLSRKLIQDLSVREGFIFHIILDPEYSDKRAFLEALIQTMGIKTPAKTTLSDSQLEDVLKDFLFQQGTQENKIVVLIIDEAQKLSETSLEVLRILLNYETNTGKLLQLVVLGQLELYPKLVNIPNLIDRISFKYILSPFNLLETRQMIDFRLWRAGYKPVDSLLMKNLFRPDAVKRIHHYSQGYPRQITLLCHNALKYIAASKQKSIPGRLIKKIRHEAKEDWSLAGKTTRPGVVLPVEQQGTKSVLKWRLAILLLVLLSGVITLVVLNYPRLKGFVPVAPMPAIPPQENRLESFYQTTVEQLKQEQDRTAQLMAELIKLREQSANEELAQRLKALETAQETARERIMTVMAEIAQTQSQVSADNKELADHLSRLKDDFGALKDKLSNLSPVLPRTRVVLEQDPAEGSYIIKICDALITSDDWVDNDPGTKSAPPDCCVMVYQNEKKIFQSKIILDTHTPKWGADEEFSLEWKKDDLIEVVIYDVDAKENEKMLGWDNGQDKGFLFKGNRLVSPKGSYLNFEVFPMPSKKE